MELKVKDMTYDQALYIAKEIVKWQKFIGILKVETSCEVIEILLNQIETLNKGIDELIKKYEEYYNNNKCNDNYDVADAYYYLIQDLKSLKGE